MTSSDSAAVPTRLSSTLVWQALKAGNKRFVHGEVRARDVVAERSRLAKSQSPKAVVLTCSDSRIAPEIVFDCGLGEVMSVRVAGGVVDSASLAAVEFAVEAFHVPLVIVMAHQRCAAVSLACTGEKPTSPHIARFVRALRPLVPKRDLSPDGVEQVIRRNAMHIASDLTHRSIALHEAVQRRELQIIAAYYWLDTGEVVRL